MLRSLLPYIGPLLIFSAFSLQQYLIHTQELSRWKGAGMGMFSSIDERMVHVTVSGSGVPLQEITHEVRENLPRTLERYRFLPTAQHKAELLERISSLEYALDTHGSLYTMYSANLENISFTPVHTRDARNSQLRTSLTTLPATSLMFDAFVVQVYDFDTQSGILSSRILDSDQ